eukprot:TRINITY_DN15503_c0_g1_i1.p1 TRINITY_DN15503_c0_g1~~TRINITY_DN15503_c0_g1_i1.p1  ORF type:complete len:405 (+),score=35.24 TRINITY_DN15503_c0_g1_i1:51-1217(+)
MQRGLVSPAGKPSIARRPDLAAARQGACAQRPVARPGSGAAADWGILGAVPESGAGFRDQSAGSSGRRDPTRRADHGRNRGRSQHRGAVSDWDETDFVARLREARCSGHSKDAAKRILREVAENNYIHRNRWRVPDTIAVPYQRGMSSRVPIYGANSRVTFSDLTTAEALLVLGKTRREVICGLNFANGSHVGGGYKNGATAQEEDLCRRMPSLYTSLNNASRDGLYPFGPCTCRTPAVPCKYADVLWTPDVVIARADEAKGYAWLPEHEQVSACLVTAAAPNINFAKPPEIDDPEMMCNTIRNILAAPRLMRPEIDTIVLGAWGCGAFGGNPAVIAELFFRVLFQENFQQFYKEIHFAIPRFSKEDLNAKVFLDTFRKHRVPVSMLR